MFSFVHRQASYTPNNNCNNFYYTKSEPANSMRGEFLNDRNKPIMLKEMVAELLLLKRPSEAAVFLPPPFDDSPQSSNDESAAWVDSQGATVLNRQDNWSTKPIVKRVFYYNNKAKKPIVVASRMDRIRRQTKQTIDSPESECPIEDHPTSKSIRQQHHNVTTSPHRTKRCIIDQNNVLGMGTDTTNNSRPSKSIRRFKGVPTVSSGAKRSIDPTSSSLTTTKDRPTKCQRRFKGDPKTADSHPSGTKRSIESFHLLPKKRVRHHAKNVKKTTALIHRTKRTSAEFQQQDREIVDICPVFLINRERFRRPTLCRLVRNPVLDCIAYHHATTMANTGIVQHSVSSSEKLQAKLGHEMVGENVFRGDSIVSMHNETMMLSTTTTTSVSQLNVLSKNFREIGSAVVVSAKDGKLYACQVFRG